MTDRSRLRNPAAGAGSHGTLLDAGGLRAALRRQRWWLLVPTLLAASVAAVYGIIRPANYVASVQILIDPRGQQLAGKDGAPTVVNGGVLSAIVESQMRVMLARSVLRDVVRREGLDRDPEFIETSPDFAASVRRWLAALAGGGRRQSNRALTALDVLSNNVKAERLKNTFVVNLHVTSGDRHKAARIANAIAEVYTGSNSRARRQADSRAATSLSKRQGLLRSSLAQAEARLQAYRKGHDVAGARAKLINKRQLGALNLRLAAQQALTAKARARYQQIRTLARNKVALGALPPSIASPGLRQLQGQLAAALSRQTFLQSRLLPAHPALRQAKAMTRGLRRRIGVELSRLAASARLDLERARADEGLLQRKLSRRQRELAGIARKADAVQTQLQQLQRMVQAKQAAYDALLAHQPSRRTGIASPMAQARTQTQARVLWPALAPAMPDRPPLALLLGSGLLVGFAFAALFALLREQGRQAILAARRASRETGQPVVVDGVPDGVRPEQRAGSAADAYQAMATVRDSPPFTRFLKPPPASHGRRNGAGCDPGATFIPGGDAIFASIPELTSKPTSGRLNQDRQARGPASCSVSFGDMMLALHPDSKGKGAGTKFRQAIAGMLRKIRTTAAPGQPQIVMLVAGHAGAGTSSTALSLAYAAAIKGLRCLLVDACSPDAELSATFSAALVQKRPCVLDSKEHLAELLTRDGASSLQLLPIALANLNRLDVAQRRRLCVGMAKLADDYDLVVIDGGAVLEDNAPLDLASCADQLLIVARSGITLTETIEVTGLKLGSARDRLAGVVLAAAAQEN